MAAMAGKAPLGNSKYRRVCEGFKAYLAVFVSERVYKECQVWSIAAFDALRGRPLMIWGGAAEKMLDTNIFVLAEALKKKISLKKAFLNIFCRRMAFEIFSLENGLRIF